MKPSDWMCFYASGKGVVGYCQIKSAPLLKPHPKVHPPERYPYTFDVENVKLFLEKPVVINSDLRSKLDAFKGLDPQRPWGFFVVSSHRITKHDFMIITRQSE